MGDIQPIIDNASKQYADTIKQYQWSLLPDSQLHAAKMALTKSKYIMDVAANNPESVFNALYQAAVLGLDLTEGKRQAWLIPRKLGKDPKTNKDVYGIVLQPGYKGVEAIHQRMEVINRCEITVVFENDKFEWSGKAADIPDHQAANSDGNIDWFADEIGRGRAKGAFIVTHYPDGAHQTVLESIHNIYEKHRNRSDAWKVYQAKLKKKEYAYPPPWASDENEMIKKTMVFIASKQWPACTQNQEVNSQILETLHTIDVSDYSPNYTPEQKQAFYDMIDARDGLGLYLFDRYVGMEVSAWLWLDLSGSIPRGQKAKQMGQMRDESGNGVVMLENIKQALIDQDMTMLYENMDGITEMGKKLLTKQLSAIEQISYKEMTQDLENNQ